MYWPRAEMLVDEMIEIARAAPLPSHPRPRFPWRRLQRIGGWALMLFKTKPPKTAGLDDGMAMDSGDRDLPDVPQASIV